MNCKIEKSIFATPNQREALRREAPVRAAEIGKNRSLIRQTNILFAGLISVYSVSAFPLNSQFCGQIFRRSRASAFRTNSRALQKKNPQIFVLPARKSEDFWSEWRDSNPRPLGPEPSAIPNFATPRICLLIILTKRNNVKTFFWKEN